MLLVGLGGLAAFVGLLTLCIGIDVFQSLGPRTYYFCSWEEPLV